MPKFEKSTGYKMRGFSGFGNSPAKGHEEGHEEEKVIEAHNEKLAEYLKSSGKKTLRGGIQAAREGYAEQEGPKFDGFFGKIFGGK